MRDDAFETLASTCACAELLAPDASFLLTQDILICLLVAGGELHAAMGFKRASAAPPAVAGLRQCCSCRPRTLSSVCARIRHRMVDPRGWECRVALVCRIPPRTVGPCFSEWRGAPLWGHRAYRPGLACLKIRRFGRGQEVCVCSEHLPKGSHRVR